jgi:hypothetical protein
LKAFRHFWVHSASDFAPALLLGLMVTVASAAAHLMPFGTAVVLVRVADPAPRAALQAASLSDAGFAVLFGNASRIRSVSGLATLWTGKAPCATTP